MSAELKSNLVPSVESAAKQAGLVLLSATQGSDFHGQLSEGFEFNKPDLLPTITAHLAAEAKRLRNPRPDCYVTLGGLPLAFGQFQWPFHRSTSGSDTYIVH